MIGTGNRPIAGKVSILGSIWGWRWVSWTVGLEESHLRSIGRGHQTMLWSDAGVEVVQVSCLHAWNGNESTGALGLGRGGARS